MSGNTLTVLSPDENKALNRVEKTAGKLVLQSRPVRISMNMTGKCNIRCIYCHLTYADYFTKAELTTEQFARLDDFLPSLAHLVYFSSTEPLSARHFKAIFEASSALPAETYLSSNALIMSEEISEMFVRGGLDFLTISVAGLTRESFKKAHQVDQLDRLVENIEALNRLKRAHGRTKPRLRLVFVTWKENAHELPEAVRFAHSYGFSEGLKITYLKAYTDDLIDQIPFDHQEEVQRWVREAQSLGEELDLPVTFDGGNFDDSPEETIHGFHRHCFEPWERFHVEADGRVRTCASTTNDTFAGDLNSQTPEEIWNGELFQEFRRRVNTPDPPEVCKRCTHNFHKDFRRRDVWDQRDLSFGIYRRLGDGRSYLKGRDRGQTER